MARRQPDSAEQAILAAAARLLGTGEGELVVLLIRGEVIAIRPGPVPAGQVPEGLGAYDTAVLGALADRPLSSAQLARRSGHPHNSYFRRRLAGLVEAGHIRHTRRGYRPAGG